MQMILSFFNNFSSLLLRTQISFIPLFVLIQKVEQKNQGEFDAVNEVCSPFPRPNSPLRKRPLLNTFCWTTYRMV